MFSRHTAVWAIVALLFCAVPAHAVCEGATASIGNVTAMVTTVGTGRLDFSYAFGGNIGSSDRGYYIHDSRYTVPTKVSLITSATTGATYKILNDLAYCDNPAVGSMNFTIVPYIANCPGAQITDQSGSLEWNTLGKVTSIEAVSWANDQLQYRVGYSIPYHGTYDAKVEVRINNGSWTGSKFPFGTERTGFVSGSVSCAAAGGPVKIEARVVTCVDYGGRISPPKTKFADLPEGKGRIYDLAARFDRADGPNGTVTVTGRYDLPANVSSRTITVVELPHPSDIGTMTTAVTRCPISANGPAGSKFSCSFSAAAIDIATMTLQASMASCAGSVEESTGVEDCTACPKSKSADPVSYIDGSMQYFDNDALPPVFNVAELSRAYDTNHGLRSLFGRGWFSMFDSRLSEHTTSTGSTISIWTPAFHSAVFVYRNGIYKQLAPKGQNGSGMLSLDTSANLYTYRPAGTVITQLYDKADGRFVGFRDPLGRDSRITYSATGLPLTVTDSWTGITWSITTDPATYRITRIDAAGLTWAYIYDNYLLQRVTVNGNTWRTYEYSNNRLTVARDSNGNLIESHTYDTYGRAIDSTGPTDEIQSVEHNAPGSTADKLITRVTEKSGAVTDYILQPTGGGWRTVQIIGSCSSCATRNATYVYDTLGHVIREQNASGYITVNSYAGGRLVSTAGPYRPAGCDPDASPTQCRLDSETLAGVPLEATDAAITTTSEYGDPAWPDRVTARSVTSVVDSQTLRRATFAYDPMTGELLQSSVSGATKRLAGTVVAQTRTTQTTLYQAAEGAAFSPGGSYYAPAWESLSQPRLAKTNDGPLPGAVDVTTFVYYPVHQDVVPALLRGRLAAVKNAAGHVTRYEDYDQFGNARRIIDPNGVVTERTFDAVNRPLATTTKAVVGCDTAADPLCGINLIESNVYTAGGLLDYTQRAGGGITKYMYDGRSRVIAISRGPSLSSLLERIEYTYDPTTSKKTKERVFAFENSGWAEKKSETYGYDAEGHLTTVTHGDGTAVVYAYDDAGRALSVRDENHATPNTLYAYDPAERLETVTQTLADGTIRTDYTYDRHGNLASVKDPNGNVTHYTYDDFGSMISQTSPVSGTTLYEYDVAGNLTQTKDANAVVTTRSYDTLGRVTQATSTPASGGSETILWSYDGTAAFGRGRLAKMTDPTGETTYEYDRRGLLLKETKSINGTPYVTAFQYDRDGNRSRITYPGSGRIVTYTFDYAGRPSTAAAGATTLVSSATYLPFGPMTEIVYGNGTKRSQTFDTRYRPLTNRLSTPSTTIASYAYSYDNVGNITAIADALDATYNRTFAYDDLNRLVAANTGSSLWQTATYAYDAMGNMTSAPGRSFSYVGSKPLLQSVTETGTTSAVTYDAAGNETLARGASYGYNARNHLATAGKYSFGYDGRGIRTTTVTTESCPGVVAPAAFALSAAASIRTITITAVPECAWIVSTAAAWITVGTASGSGDGATSVTIARNFGATSRAAIITINNTEIPVFQQGTTNSSLASDFFADGTADIVARNALTGAVTFHQTDGASILSSTSSAAESGTFSRVIVSGDVDGDGRSDILERNNRTGELVVRLMNGAAMASSTTILTGTNYAKVGGMADVSGDGKAEILTRNESTGVVREWTRATDGSWSAADVVTESDRQWTIAALADFTADGRADLLWRNARTGAVQVQVRESAISFSGTRTVIFTDAETWWTVVGAADIDGDGYADVISYNPRSGQVKVRRMSQTTILAAWTLAGKPQARWTIAQIGDFNADGRADLLWRDGNTGALEVQLLSGSTVISTAALILPIDVDWKIAGPVTAYAAQGNARPDLGGDGKSDILWRKTTAEGYVSLWEMNGRTTAATGTIAGLSDQNWQIKGSADFNGDRKDDVLLMNSATGSVATWEMNGREIVSGGEVASLPSGWNVAAAGSFDGDRAADIILMNGQTLEVGMWRMTGSTGRTILEESQIAVLENALWKLTGTADFNGDGRMDLLWMHPDGRVAIWWMEGATIFGGRTIAQINPSSGMEIHRTGDFTGDGRADIVWRDKTSGYLWLWEIPDDRTPVAALFDQRVTDPQWQIQSTASDYNGDGRQELLWRNTTTGDLAIWELRGTTLVNGNTFATLATFWAVPPIDPDGKAVYGSSTPATVAALATRAPWWTPAPNAPPFWSVQPGKPSVAKPPHGGPPPWAPAQGLREPEHVPAPYSLPWWEPVPPGADSSNAYLPSQRRSLWTSLLHRLHHSGADRVPVSLSVGNEPLVADVQSVPATITLRRYSLYTPELKVLAETKTTAATAATMGYEYVWFGAQPLAQIETATGAIHYYFNDHLGTPLLQTDSSAAVSWRAEYLPYGEVTAYRLGTAKHQPLRFPGQEHELGSELSYNVARWYRASLGRYTQADPVGVGGHGHFEDGRLDTWVGSPIARRTRRSRTLAARIQSEVNGFQYAGANPLSFIDPRGLSVFPPLLSDGGPEKILCTVYRVFKHPWKNLCGYVGKCTGIVTWKTYLAAGIVEVMPCKECSPVCTYESTANTIASPDDWECTPPMMINKWDPSSGPPGWM